MKPPKPQNNNGSIRLRWRYQGRPYNLNLPGLQWHKDQNRAQLIALTIAQDTDQGSFDGTLSKYRAMSAPAPKRYPSDRKKYPPKKPKVFNASELRAIANNIDPHYLGFFLFLSASGCRIGEVAGLDFDRVDFDRQEVTISRTYSRNSRTGAWVMKARTKTGTVRELASPYLIEVILREPTVNPEDPRRSTGPVFLNHAGNRICHHNFRNNAWRTALRDAGVEYRRVHVLRHTALSHSLESGLSVPQVAYLAGHRDNSMVLKTYGHIIDRPTLPKPMIGLDQ
jgi:integrase